MILADLSRYAYIRKPLTAIYSRPEEVPEEFWYDWWKDAYDYQREQDEEELRERLLLTPRDILTWLEEAADFMWKCKGIYRQILMR